MLMFLVTSCQQRISSLYKRSPLTSPLVAEDLLVTHKRSPLTSPLVAEDLLTTHKRSPFFFTCCRGSHCATRDPPSLLHLLQRISLCHNDPPSLLHLLHGISSLPTRDPPLSSPLAVEDLTVQQEIPFLLHFLVAGDLLTTHKRSPLFFTCCRGSPHYPQEIPSLLHLLHWISLLPTRDPFSSSLAAEDLLTTHKRSPLFSTCCRGSHCATMIPPLFSTCCMGSPHYPQEIPSLLHFLQRISLPTRDPLSLLHLSQRISLPTRDPLSSPLAAENLLTTHKRSPLSSSLVAEDLLTTHKRSLLLHLLSHACDYVL